MNTLLRRVIYVPFSGRSFSGSVSKTQKYGYIPAKKQIENLMLAGKRLDAFRSGLYMYNASSVENLSSLDVAALSIPFYSSELDLMEKKAYLSGIMTAKAEYLKQVADTEKQKATAVKIAQLIEAFNDATGVSKVVASDPATEASGQVTGVEGV